MSNQEIEEVIKPAMNVCETLYYDEAVTIGSVLGQLIKEIKRLRDK